jgi:hypothetical protein
MGSAYEVIRWLELAEERMSQLLGQFGPTSEIVTLGTVVLVALLAVAIAWALLLGLLRMFAGLFGAGGRREKPHFDARAAGHVGFAAMAEPAGPGRLDVVPSALARQAPQLVEPEIKTPSVRPRGTARLSQAAGGTSSGALPISPLDDLKRVQLKRMPQLPDRGLVVSARPEWTGKVIPSSLQDAGAVEICRVLSRRTPALAGNQTVRAVDYRVCGLPRVDGEGRRQPDVMVYTVADRGFLPKSAPAAKQGRR